MSEASQAKCQTILFDVRLGSSTAWPMAISFVFVDDSCLDFICIRLRSRDKYRVHLLLSNSINLMANYSAKAHLMKNY